jgi:glycine oxidase
MSATNFDFIIVGQGLAGSAVAVQLLKLRRKILVIDQPEKNNSSRIAAGMFNPITGKKMVKTWMADILFPYLHSYYREVEERTSTKFFYPMPLYRPFLSVEEQNEWMAKSSDPVFDPYIEKIFTVSSSPQLKDSFGGLLLKQSGYLNTTAYIKGVGDWIREEAMMLEENFDYASLIVDSGTVHYKNYTAGNLIFCHGAHHHPLFSWLPIRPLKGETLCIESAFAEKLIVNRGVYFVPGQKSGEWRAGATYNFNDLEPAVTENAREELEEKLAELINFPFRTIGQEWGIRPTTPDRRPMLGTHPAIPQIHIFNGLGTKGVSLTPYFSEVLIHWIENQVHLNKVVDIERYKSVYSISPK